MSNRDHVERRFTLSSNRNAKLTYVYSPLPPLSLSGGQRSYILIILYSTGLTPELSWTHVICILTQDVSYDYIMTAILSRRIKLIMVVSCMTENGHDTFPRSRGTDFLETAKRCSFVDNRSIVPTEFLLYCYWARKLILIYYPTEREVSVSIGTAVTLCSPCPSSNFYDK